MEQVFDLVQRYKVHFRTAPTYCINSPVFHVGAHSVSVVIYDGKVRYVPRFELFTMRLSMFAVVSCIAFPLQDALLGPGFFVRACYLVITCQMRYLSGFMNWPKHDLS